MKSFRVIGLMSGTSLDGLDLADVNFVFDENKQWSFKLKGSAFFTYSDEMLSRLKKATSFSGEELMAFSSELGFYYGEKVNEYLRRKNIGLSEIDFVASHGQTVFHQPENKFTTQIGNGHELSALTGLTSIVDFRSLDVALGGSGAPLIPVADHLLFKKYADSFLNLGGFSNYSFLNKNKEVKSFDICPVNIVINYLMSEIGESYDDSGSYGRKGDVDEELLLKLNALDFYQLDGPKSLGWEWVEENVLPLLDSNIPHQNKLRTFYEHIAGQLALVINSRHASNVLVTGGGAHNQYLIELLRNKCTKELVIPDAEIIDFKEAIGFAFLGVLRWRDEINVWASVTGAKRDSSSGIIIKE